MRRMELQLSKLANIAGAMESRLRSIATAVEAYPVVPLTVTTQLVPVPVGKDTSGGAPTLTGTDGAALVSSGLDTVTALVNAASTAGETGSEFVKQVVHPALGHLLEKTGDAAVNFAVEALKSSNEPNPEVAPKRDPIGRPSDEQIVRPGNPPIRPSAAVPSLQVSGLAAGAVDVPAEWTAQLAEVATFARERPDCRLVIEAHTDTVGSSTANLLLSHKRALEMERRVVGDFPIDRTRLPALLVPWGERRTPVPTPDQVPEPRNRRVDVTFSC